MSDWCPENDGAYRMELAAMQQDALASAGICEVAARNPNVMEYMKHWEGRAEKAEAERDTLAEMNRNQEAMIRQADKRDDALAEKLARAVEAATRLADLWDKDAMDRVGPATRQMRATLAAIKEGACTDAEDAILRLKPVDIIGKGSNSSVRESELKAEIHRLTAAGDNLTAWVDDRGTPDVRKWDKARDEAFRALDPADIVASVKRGEEE